VKSVVLDRALAYVGYQFARLQFRSDIDTVQPLTNFMTGARNMLVVLPIGYNDSILAGNALRRHRNVLRNVHLTVINNGTRATSLIDFPLCEVVRVDPGDLNPFSLPRRSLLQRIFTKQFDVAMNLNLDFVLHTAYICKASRARVRVGFPHDSADVFYNVLINLKAQRTPQAMYEKFAASLAMF
jgi:hypothetical protein